LGKCFRELDIDKFVGREKRSESRRSRTTLGGIRRYAAAPALHALINLIAVIPAKAGTQ
jgi:hypothetical protein